MQEAARGKVAGPGPTFVAAAAQLQLRLVEAYLALPDAAAFAMEHEALSRLCARAFRSASGTSAWLFYEAVLAYSSIIVLPAMSCRQ